MKGGNLAEGLCCLLVGNGRDMFWKLTFHDGERKVNRPITKKGGRVRREFDG